MKKQIRIFSIAMILVLSMNAMALPASAANEDTSYMVEPRYNNIINVYLNLVFDSNSVAYCSISVAPYSNCRGFDGMMRLYDSDGTQLKSWAVSDFVEQYKVEQTWQCESGKTYTLTFQGYAYSNDGTMYDELNCSTTAACP